MRAALVLSSCVAVACGVEFNGAFGEGGGGSGSGAAPSDGGAGGMQPAVGGMTPGGGGNPMGGTGGGGAGETPCHPAGLVDGFDGSSVDDAIWNTQGAPVIAVYGSALHFDPLPFQQNDQWSGLVTDAEYDVRACSVWIEVPTLAQDPTAGFSYWQLYHPDGSVVFRVAGGALEFEVNVAGMLSEVGSTSYAPAAHRWWRIREAGGTVFHETSPDGARWSVQLSAPTPPFVANSAIGLGRVSAVNVPTPGTTVFDSFNEP